MKAQGSGGAFRRPEAVATQLMRRVTRDAASGCWLFTGYLNNDGYGHIAVEGRFFGAHRLSYELARGPIPDGLHLDHLCKTRNCVNPDHLEPVTAHENWRRGASPTLANSLKVECVNGHEFDVANTYVDTSRGRDVRVCRACNRAAVARYKARKRSLGRGAR